MGRKFHGIGLTVLMVSILLYGTAYSGWQPIIGIPQPPFAVSEVAPIVPNPWSGGVASFYYVCPTCSGATDTSNAYGYPAKPRATVPNTLAAGAVVEIHGTYNGSGVSATIQGNGSASNPVFIRGVSYAQRPLITQDWTIQGAYIVLENLWFGPADSNDTDFGVSIREGTHDVALRNCEFSGNLLLAGGMGVGTWSYTGTDRVFNIILDNCFIHDMGDVNSPIDQDAHGMTVHGTADNVWLVNSELARCSGDGIQIEAQQGRRDKIHHVFVGRNNSHDNKQTGVWVKHAQDVIISQNEIFGHHTGNSSFGQGTGFQYGPENVWFLFNHIHNNDVGIGIGSDDPPGDGLDSYFIGNVIHDIHASDPNNTSNAGAFMIRGGTNRYLINNTIYRVDAGINYPTDGGKLEIINNIIGGRTASTQNEIYMEGASVSSASVVKNNLFYSPTSVRINWDLSQYTSLSSFQLATGKGENCLSADPGFVNATNNDFRIVSTSPAKDSGIVHTAYTTFLNRYGLNISKDADGTSRPQGTTWDIGAYEYSGGVSLRQPNSPTNIQIR